MTLKYKVKGKAAAEEKDVRVEFDPPLAGYEEVKPRLLGMTADAQEALGMVRSVIIPLFFTPSLTLALALLLIPKTKAPQITSFELPKDAPLKTGVPLLLLVYTTLSPWYSGPQWEPGHWLFRSFGGQSVFKGLWIVVGIVHVLEALYVQRLCVRHRTGFSVGVSNFVLIVDLV